MSVINTNITAMIGLQHLHSSQASLQTSMERLSSGLRINSAKDDAAGQAIANRFRAQITGLGQAQRNAGDGISVAQTAEGALDQINDNVQRIRELTVQAANGTNSQQDLGSIQDEINQRLSEIDRISEQTDFNGIKVLGEGARALSIQVGANDGETISIELSTINRTTLGLAGFNVNGVAASVGNTQVAEGDTFKIGEDTYTAGSTNATGAFMLASGTSIAADSGTLVQANDSDAVYIKDASGNYFAAELKVVTAGSSTAPATLQYTRANDRALDFVTEEGGATAGPLATLDDALNKIDSLRSNLGAVQNRFESTIENLGTNMTNLSAARSRIEDADYAREVANMIKQQILLQAGMSVLAQANQIPRNVLSLLG